MLNAISSLLLTIAGASASFVAILGGFIASKLISLNSERDSTQSKLKQLRYEKLHATEERNMLRHALDEEDALSYIHNHIEAIADGCSLEDVYEEDELQTIDFKTLLPYWEKAQIYIELFEERLQQDNCQLNSDFIPCDLAEEYNCDIFAYKFLMIYATLGFSDYIEVHKTISDPEWHAKTRQQILSANTKAAVLDIQEQVCQMDLERLQKPSGMKLGLLIFALFSVFNIILPLFLSAAPLAGQWCAVVLYCSIGFLTLGLCATFWYLASMLKWKEQEI